MEERSFEEMLEESLKDFKKNKRVKGIVERITSNEVYVDIGGKQTGVIPLEELSEDVDVKPEDVVKIGDEIDVLILKTKNQEDSLLTLSKKQVDKDKKFEEICKDFENKTILKGKVIEVVKGGILVEYEGYKVFIPASLAILSKKEKLEDMLLKNVDFRIKEVDEPKKRIVGTIKDVLKEKEKESKKRFWENVEIGKEYKGKVKTLENFGAFVDIGGIDGMIHISELSWNKIKHPSEILKVGDEIKVRVKDLDKDNERIALVYKQEEDNPWKIMENKYKPGDIVEVTITGFTDFGAFAKIINGVDGLIHISQICDRRIDSPQDVLKIGQNIKVMIQEIEADRKRVKLSINAINETKE